MARLTPSRLASKVDRLAIAPTMTIPVTQVATLEETRVESLPMARSIQVRLERRVEDPAVVMTTKKMNKCQSSIYSEQHTRDTTSENIK